VAATDAFGLRSTPVQVAVETGGCAPTVLSITSSAGAPAINQAFTLTAVLPVFPAVPDTCMAGAVLSYDWRIVSAPHGSAAHFSSNGAITTGFTADLAGRYQFEVVATDQGGFASSPTAVSLVAGSCGAVLPALADPVSNPVNFDAGDRLVLSSAVTDSNLASCGALTKPYHWQWALL